MGIRGDVCERVYLSIRICSVPALNACDADKLTVCQGGAIAYDVHASIALDRDWTGKANKTLVF